MIDNNLENLTLTYLEDFNKIDIKLLTLDYYNSLISVLKYHNSLYYIYSKPTISDFQYDQLYNYLLEIEGIKPEFISVNSPTQRLVWQLQDWFDNYSHKIPLLSLENSYSWEDLLDWNDFLSKRIDNYTFFIEPKFDWVSIELVYKNWHLFKWITRWDWYLWEDITLNISTISTIPLFVEWFKSFSEVSLRWEIVMPKKSFNILNENREKSWLQVFSNPRNAVSWTIRLLDSSEVLNRKLVCFIYDILYINLWEKNDLNNILSNEIWKDNSDLNQSDILLYLKNIWFNIFDWYKSFSNISDVVDICWKDDTKIFFDNQNIEFDWLVIKVSEILKREQLWSTNHHPRWAIAYKFPAKQIVTKLLSVDYNVSRNWTITPVANLDKVSLSWVNISKATLHNFDFISSKDIRINDYVWIQRSWEVIPYIVSSIKEKRDWSEQLILPPDICPVCSSEIFKFPDDVAYYCININCPSVIKEKLAHFVSKDCLDIKWFWDKLIDLLVNSWFINNYSDIYKLKYKKTELKSLPLMWDKRVEELLLEIEKSKNKTLNSFINWLWIKFVWKKTSKILEYEIYNFINSNDNSDNSILEFDYNSLIEFLTNDNFLRSIYWIWEKIIISLEKHFAWDQNYKILKELSECWILFNNFSIRNNSNKPLLWLKFSITWTFNYKRDFIIMSLEDLWAEFFSQPTLDCDFLLSWDKWWSKLEKAKKLGISIIDLNELIIRYPILSNKFQIKSNLPIQQGLF